MTEPVAVNISEIRDHVDKFIKRYYNLEVVISPEAHKLTTKRGGAFSDSLAEAITHYQCAKDNTETLKICLSMINKTYSHGLIIPGSDLLTKLDDCKKTKSDLLSDLATCMTNYTNLQKEHERLVRMLDQNQTPNQNVDENPSENDEQPKSA